MDENINGTWREKKIADSAEIVNKTRDVLNLASAQRPIYRALTMRGSCYVSKNDNLNFER